MILDTSNDLLQFNGYNLNESIQSLLENEEITLDKILKMIFDALRKFFKQFINWMDKNVSAHRKMFEKVAPILDEYAPKVNGFLGYPKLTFEDIMENYFRLDDLQHFLQSNLILESKESSSREVLMNRIIDILDLPSLVKDETNSNIILSVYRKKLLFGNKAIKYDPDKSKEETKMTVEDLNYNCIESFRKNVIYLQDSVNNLEERLKDMIEYETYGETSAKFCQKVFINTYPY